jgi:hypothetical protein
MRLAPGATVSVKVTISSAATLVRCWKRSPQQFDLDPITGTKQV